MEKVGDNEYKLLGDLTKGITKQITLNTEFGGYNTDPYGSEQAGFSLEGKINRNNFGLNWNVVFEAGGVMVGDEIRIHADVECKKVN